MFPLKKIKLVLLFGLITLAACSTKSTSQSIPATATQPPRPTVTVLTAVPTPSSPSDSILWDDLQVTMDQLEITNEYVTDFGSTRIPPAGTKFLWVHVQMKNIGQVEMEIPVFEHFSILFAADGRLVHRLLTRELRRAVTRTFSRAGFGATDVPPDAGAPLASFGDVPLEGGTGEELGEENPDEKAEAEGALVRRLLDVRLLL